MVRVLNIDGVRCELLLPPNAKMLAVSVTASSFVINDHAKPKDYSHFFWAQTGSNLAGRCPQLPRGLMSRLLYAAALSSSILLSPAHAQSPFTPAPLGEDILQKARDWQAAPNAKPPTEFRAGHVTPRQLSKDALQAKPGGFEVTLPSGAPVTTPTVYDGKVFTSGGFKSKQFYAVDAKTGQLVWALDLDDDGPSSAACDAGHCAFNTESCTLFVVDANTGKQVWSLWLGDL